MKAVIVLLVLVALTGFASAGLTSITSLFTPDEKIPSSAFSPNGYLSSLTTIRSTYFSTFGTSLFRSSVSSFSPVTLDDFNSYLSDVNPSSNNSPNSNSNSSSSGASSLVVPAAALIALVALF